jgi:hypothetical protein
MTSPRLSLSTLAILAISLLAPGCAKMADASYSPSDAGYAEEAQMEAAFGYDPMQSTAMGGSVGASGGGGGDDYAFEDDGDAVADAMDEPMPMAENASVSRSAFSRSDRRAERRSSRGAKFKTAGEAPPPEPAREEPGEKPLEQPDDPSAKVAKPQDEEEPEDHGRQIIYTAAMIVAVHDVSDATERAEKLPLEFGGYVHQRSEGMLVLKVPAAKLRKTMDALAAYGIVQGRQLQAQDVTAEYTDLVSRIKVLRDTQAQLLKLLEEAKTVEETLRVRQALDQVTMQLETALGRMRQLSNAIGFSTLTIRFQERSPQHHLPSSNDPFGWVDQLGVESTEWR